MDVLLVRHACAFERDAKRWPDDRQRPLTREGMRRFRKMATRLRSIAPRVEQVWASPLVRAWQTAILLEEHARWPAPQETSALEPGRSPAGIATLLRRNAAASCIALVGHDADFGGAVAYLTGGAEGKPVVEMKKGGAALIRFERKPGKGAGVLVWLASPRLFLGDR